MIPLNQRELLRKLQEFSPFILERNLAVSGDPDTRIFFLKGWVIFIDHSILEFAEKYSTAGHRYRFHYMDSQNRLMMRWDNVPHHPEISTFPHHRHTPRTVELSQEMSLIDALAYIAANLLPQK